MALDSYPNLMNVEEAAAYVRVAAQSLRNWRTADRGPRALKLGSLVRYRRMDLDRWLDEECGGAEGEEQ